jgi:hypothetical protein
MTKAELLADLDNRISSAKVKGFWSDAMKLVWLNDAGKRVCNWRSPAIPGFKRWSFLELAMETQSRGSKEYYDYPPNMKQSSIYQIDVEEEDEARDGVSWETFQKHKEQENDVQIFANHEGYYFLYSVPEDGKVISVYGERKWVNLVADADLPITPEDLDEAIVRIALASCLKKAKKYNEAQSELSDVLDPEFGVIAQFARQQDVGGQKGYVGQARSTRF